MEVISSLLAITICALLAPLITHIIPRNLVPEAVVLIAMGIVIGPQVANLAHADGEIRLLSELGLAFLFLLAGYEVDLEDLQSGHGMRASIAWFASFVLAFMVLQVRGHVDIHSKEVIAVAIAMTSTALGTLLPILKERGIADTAVGRIVMTHGTIGEMFPIIAIALLLSYDSIPAALMVLVIFGLSALLLLAVPARAQRLGLKIVDLVHLKAEGTAQATVRGTVALLVGLSALALWFNLDMALGAFAAGLIVRQLVPQGRNELDQKLDGLAYGFFIPLFFIVSGMNIDLAIVRDDPLSLVSFLVALMVVRGLPVFFSTHGQKTAHHPLTIGERARIGLYSTTALPIIVAVTHVAVAADAMTHRVQSTLILAGTLSVLVMPMLAAITQSRTRTSELDPDDPEDLDQPAAPAPLEDESPTD